MTVTVGLMMFLTVVYLISAGATVVAFGEMVVDAVENSPFALFIGVIGLIPFGMNAAQALVMAVLAKVTRKGKDSARRATWVVGGLFSLGGVINAIGGMPTLSDPALWDAYPDWYGTANLLVGCVTLPCCLAMMLLLALPQSRAYFHQPSHLRYGPPAPPSRAA